MYDTLWPKNVYKSIFSISIYKYWPTKTYSFWAKESILKWHKTPGKKAFQIDVIWLPIGGHILSFDWRRAFSIWTFFWIVVNFSRVIHAIRQCTQYFEYCYICLHTVVSRWSTLYNIQVYTFRTLAEAVKWLSLYKLKYRHGWKSCLIKNIGKNYLNGGLQILAHIKLESVVVNIVILVTESSWRYPTHANFGMLVIEFLCWWHLLTIRHKR